MTFKEAFEEARKMSGEYPYVVVNVRTGKLYVCARIKNPQI